MQKEYNYHICVHANIPWASKCSIKPLSKLLIFVSTAVYTGFQGYDGSSLSRSSANQIRIFKNSKDLLETLSSRSPFFCNNNKIWRFVSVLYTTIPHTQLKFWLRDWSSVASQRRTENKGSSILLLVRDKSYFFKSHLKYNNKYEQDKIIQMWDVFIDYIFVQFDRLVFQPPICISMGTNCVPQFRGFILHAYEEDSFQDLLKNKDRELA